MSKKILPIHGVFGLCNGLRKHNLHPDKRKGHIFLFWSFHRSFLYLKIFVPFQGVFLSIAGICSAQQRLKIQGNFLDFPNLSVHLRILWPNVRIQKFSIEAAILTHLFRSLIQKYHLKTFFSVSCHHLVYPNNFSLQKKSYLGIFPRFCWIMFWRSFFVWNFLYNFFSWLVFD